MSTDVRYQVFVSSTYEDLKYERRIVIESIMGMRCIPAGMELFEAGNSDQWTYIQQRIDESDYYVVIVGQRYGSKGPSGKSYTQMEYEYAVSQGVPVAAFLLDEATRANWPLGRTEVDALKQVDEFRALCRERLVKFWRTPDELGRLVVTGLMGLIKDNSRAGWVRGDRMASDAALEEIARLSEERRKLQAQVEALSAARSELVAPPEVRARMDRLQKLRVSAYLNMGTADVVMRSDPTLLEVFNTFALEFAGKISTHRARTTLAQALFGDTDGIYIECRQVFNELARSDLIAEESVTSYTFKNPNTHDLYYLTDFGKKFLLYLDHTSPVSRRARDAIDAPEHV